MRVTYTDTTNYGHIEITDGIITGVGRDVDESTSDEVIDCSHLIAWPGLIDSHVHFRTPGQEYKEDWITGSAAALAGGVTTVQDMPNNLVPITNQALLNKKRVIVNGSATVEALLSITPTDETMAEFMEAEPYADAIKLFMGSTTGNIVLQDKASIERVFKETTKPLMIHAESESIVRSNEVAYKDQSNPEIHSAIRSREAAVSAVIKALELAKQYDREIYLCHVSTAEELELVREARQDGVRVYVEVTPHHLVLNKGEYANAANFVRVNPALRDSDDNAALWNGIADGTVSIVATDHAPHTQGEKEESYWKAPSGMPGVEFMFPLLLTAANEGNITLEDIKRCVIEHPAKLFGLTKEISVGSAADLVLFDPAEEWIVQHSDIKSKVGWSPYLGYRMVGKVKHTVKHLP